VAVFTVAAVEVSIAVAAEASEVLVEEGASAIVAAAFAVDQQHVVTE